MFSPLRRGYNGQASGDARAGNLRGAAVRQSLSSRSGLRVFPLSRIQICAGPAVAGFSAFARSELSLPTCGGRAGDEALHERFLRAGGSCARRGGRSAERHLARRRYPSLRRHVILGGRRHAGAEAEVVVRNLELGLVGHDVVGVSGTVFDLFTVA